ncbi:MAG TPA: ATP-binding protein [Acidobacteriaceae bacterium]|nr:ATP-binding protein [Acidobacteriaceae bacterium]
MYTRRLIEAARWLAVAIVLAAITVIYGYCFRVNHTTVALTMLLLVLVIAGNVGLRYAVGASIGATILFNFFFLPPVNTLTIADTQNWIALFAFLGTAIYAAHLAARIREEAGEANARRRESEMLYRLGRQLLQPENVGQLFNYIPSAVASAFNSPAVTLYVADRDRIYLSEPRRISSLHIQWRDDATAESSIASERPRSEVVRDLREAMNLPIFHPPESGYPAAIPLRIGVRPAGALLLEATPLSREAMEALSGLVSMSIERAEALETSARAEAAKETERLRTALLDSVTHDLRTPLTGIKASITALLSQPALQPSEQQEFLTVINEESDRLNHLIEQAVEMAQLDANKVQLDLQPHRIADLIDPAISEHRLTCPARDFRVSISAGLPMVLADAAWMGKVLANLLGNAVKYSPLDQPIFLTAELQNDFVAISVADRGQGIDPFEQESIFDKFYRGRSYRDPALRQHIAGTGMGLAIARAIVDAHGGTISVTSQRGHGSVFTFTLPVARMPEHQG